MKERMKTILHLLCIFADVGYSSCVLFISSLFQYFFQLLLYLNQVLQNLLPYTYILYILLEINELGPWSHSRD